MKIGLKRFSSDQSAAIRICMASVVLLPISIQQIDIISLLIAGFIGSLIPAFIFMKAETCINSSLAVMFNSLMPVFTMIVGLLFHKAAFRWMQIGELSFGLARAISRNKYTR